MKNILSFCSSAVIFGALFMLVPSGKINKTVRFAFCLCLILSILSGVSHISKITFKEPDFYLTEDMTDISDKTAKTVFENALKSQNISFSDITVITSKNAQGSINIIEVAVKSSEDPEKIKKAIGNDNYYKVSVNGV